LDDWRKHSATVTIEASNSGSSFWKTGGNTVPVTIEASNSGSSFWTTVGNTVPQSHQDNYAAASIVALFFASNNCQALFKKISNLWCDIQ